MRGPWVGLILAVALTACGGLAPSSAGTDPTPPAPSEAATATELEVTITEADCSLGPAPGSIPTGDIALVGVNDTDAPAAVDMWRIDASASFEELAAHIAEEAALAASGEPGLGHPSYASGLISSGPLEAGASARVGGTVTEGIYGIVCLRHFAAVTDDPFRPFTVLGPIEVVAGS